MCFLQPYKSKHDMNKVALPCRVYSLCGTIDGKARLQAAISTLLERWLTLSLSTCSSSGSYIRSRQGFESPIICVTMAE